MSIVLTTLNARYHHASLALRYIFANIGDVQAETEICEFTISQPAQHIVATLLEKKPDTIGFGIYIWNVQQTLAVIRLLKEIAPHITIVLGGPEVSFDSPPMTVQPICEMADFVIQGEADLAFGDLVRDIRNHVFRPKWFKAPRPDVTTLKSPYVFYSDEDIAHRTIYVEASRGCPYTCEFCLSSLDEAVRNFPLEDFFADLTHLMVRGVRQFKFIDRTFNLSPQISTRILQFFLHHIDRRLFLHFEMVPDRLPEILKALILQFPAGSLQFEVGIQTFNVDVAKRISRKQNYQKTSDNLRFLIDNTKVYVHADLIAGLPGENEDSFARGFDQLFALNPHEIQVGILKHLKGTPLTRHDAPYSMRYNLEPPFEIIETSTMDATTLNRIKIFSKFWDKIANSGRFSDLMAGLRSHVPQGSMYHWMMSLSLFLYGRFTRTHSIPLDELIVAVSDFLQNSSEAGNNAKALLTRLPKIDSHPLARLIADAPKRQGRHLQAT